MLCYVLHAVGDLRAEERPTPVPGLGEAVIRIAGCAICHTDLAVIEGNYPGPRLPAILGHEYAGTVTAVGPGTTAVGPGDRVAAYSTLACGLCQPCRQGTPWLCRNRRSVWGGFAEYVALPERCFFKVPDAVTDEQAISTNPFSIAVRALELAELRPGDTTVVIGGGAIGLVVVGLLRFSGAGNIIVSEPSAERRALAMEFGATVALDPAEHDIAAAVRALTDGLGSDLVFEAVGIQTTVEQAVTLVRRGGAVVLLGMPAPNVEVRLRPYDIAAGCIRIIGSFGPGWTYPRTIELLTKVRPERVITHRFPLAELPAAVQLRQRNVGVKALVVP